MSLIDEKERIPLKSLTLYDNDKSRQKLIGKAAQILLKEHYTELEYYNLTTKKENAFKNADKIFVQIRTGGISMREKDEQLLSMVWLGKRHVVLEVWPMALIPLRI